MTVYISEIVGSIGGISTPPTNIMDIETTLTPASATATAAYASGAWVTIYNGEATAIRVAKGTTPVATTTTKTATSSAYFVIAPGADNGVPLLLLPGEKIAWVAV